MSDTVILVNSASLSFFNNAASACARFYFTFVLMNIICYGAELVVSVLLSSSFCVNKTDQTKDGANPPFPTFSVLFTPWHFKG
jgi:hypothetical protein